MFNKKAKFIPPTSLSDPPTSLFVPNTSLFVITTSLSDPPTSLSVPNTSLSVPPISLSVPPTYFSFLPSLSLLPPYPFLPPPSPSHFLLGVRVIMLLLFSSLSILAASSLFPSKSLSTSLMWRCNFCRPTARSRASNSESSHWSHWRVNYRPREQSLVSPEGELQT